MGHFQMTQPAFKTAHSIVKGKCGNEITISVTKHYPSDLRRQLLTDTQLGSITTAFTQSYKY